MPPRSTFLFLLAVFLVFAPVGFVTDIWSGGDLSMVRLVLSVLYSGFVAIGYAYAFTRNLKVLPLTIIFQFGFHFIPWGAYFPGGPETAAAIQNRMILDGIGIIVCIILAYVFFIMFISAEGIKQIALSREMELAGEIHRVLVPDFNVTNREFDITGRSSPTDEVGGDLIDMIAGKNETIVYMIDVSGHGVGPGLLSGMFKASMRSLYEPGKTLQTVVNHIHGVLLDHRKKGMFITFGGLRFYEQNKIELVLAGHPPIIRIDKQGNFEETKFTQLPLLALRGYNFDHQMLTAQPGDLFIIYSDGIIETNDKKGLEFGFERLRELLRASHRLPVQKISERVYTELKRHGQSSDDQSLIVIRKN